MTLSQMDINQLVTFFHNIVRINDGKNIRVEDIRAIL